MHEKQENKWDVKAGTYHFEDQLESVKYLDRFFKMEKFLLLYYNYGWMREYLSDLILNFNKINITVKPIFFTPKFTALLYLLLYELKRNLPFPSPTFSNRTYNRINLP